MRCVILGGGGHARVLITCLQAGGHGTPYAILDPDERRWGTELLGVPIRGGDEQLAACRANGATHFIVGQGGIGDNTPRKRLFALGRAQGLTPLTVVHPSVICAPSVVIGEGTMLFPGAIINPGVVLGVNVIINTGAIVEHDCQIGDHAHIAPGAVLSGTVHVAEGAHVGVGAVVRQDIRIGAGAIVGAGAVVVRDVSPGATVKGVPAQ